MFTLLSGLVGLVVVAIAVIFFLALGLLIKLAALKLFAAVALKATLHGVFPHFFGAVLLMMIMTLLIAVFLAGFALRGWWP